MLKICDIIDMRGGLLVSDKDRYLLVHTNTSIHDLIINTPLVVSKECYNAGLDKLNTGINKFIQGVCPLPPLAYLSPGYLEDFKINHLSESKEDSVFNTLAIKEVDELPIKEISNIKEYVDKNGGISFILKDKIRSKKFIEDFSKYDYYKYKLLYYSNLLSNKNNSGSNIGQTTPVVTFIKLNQCIPILNSRKVDGIVVYIQAVLDNSTGIYGKYPSLMFVLSNYPENVLIIDGQNINEERYAQAGHYEIMLEAFLSENSKEGKSETAGLEDMPTQKFYQEYTEIKHKDEEDSPLNDFWPLDQTLWTTETSS